MPLKLPPIADLTLLQTGRFTKPWVEWLQSVWKYLSGQEPIALASYTVATVPSAILNPAALIYVTNETGGAVPAFSDGTDWRRVTDRAIIS